jgi:phage-related protein
MSALPLQTQIAQTTKFERGYRKREMRLGEGFSNRVQDGLNAIVWKGTVDYVNLSQANLTTLLTFIDGIGSWGYFDYTPNGSSTSCKFSVDAAGLSISTTGGQLFNVSFTCRQEYDL